MKVFDGTFTTRWHYQEHDGQLTRVYDQPSKNAILERNKQLRLNKGALLDLGAQSGGVFGRQIAAIPEIVFLEAMRRDGYQFFHPDKMEPTHFQSQYNETNNRHPNEQ